MSLTKQIAHSALWAQAGKLIQFPLSFAFSVMIARQLGSENYGIYIALTSVCMLVSMVSALGFEDTININLPKMYAGKDIGKAAFFLKRTLLLRMGLTIVASTILYLSSGLIADFMHTSNLSGYIRFAICYVLISNVYALMDPVLTSYFRQKTASIIRTFELIIKVIIAFVLFKVVGGINSVIIALILSSLAGLALFIYSIRKELSVKSEVFELRSIYKTTLIVWLTSFVNYLLGANTDILCMGYFAVGNADIGFYNIAFSLTTILSTIAISGFGAVTLAASSRIANQFGEQRLSQTWRLNIQTTNMISIPILLFSLFVADPLIRLFYSTEYVKAIILFQIYINYHLVFRVLGGGAHSTVFYAMNKTKTVLWLRVSAGLLNLLLDIIFIPKWGALGAIIATGTSTLILLVAELFVLSRNIVVSYPYIMTLKIIASCLLSLFIISRVIVVNNLPYLFLSGSIYFILLVSILFFLKPMDREYGLFLASIHPKLGFIASKFEK